MRADAHSLRKRGRGKLIGTGEKTGDGVGGRPDEQQVCSSKVYDLKSFLKQASVFEFRERERVE